MSTIVEMFQKTLSLAKALITGTDVSEDRLRARLEICSTCDKVKHDGNTMRCGICGCKLADTGLVNLARYEEDPDKKYGCMHPDGSRWKAKGV
jgi:uncharacterized paraquat-inducible protein A